MDVTIRFHISAALPFGKKPGANLIALISGFRSDVDKICGLLGYYAASCVYRRFGTTYRSNTHWSRVRVGNVGKKIII
jgi:hypothetical protein